MATISGSPLNQPSVALSGIDLLGIISSGTPIWKSIKTVEGSSVLIVFGGGGEVPATPTVGQVWPLGYLST